MNQQHLYGVSVTAERSLSSFALITALQTTAMTQSNGENPQRTRSGLNQIRARIQSRSLLAMKRAKNISKDDVKGFFIRNAFVLLTIAAVIIGKRGNLLFSLEKLNSVGSLAGAKTGAHWKRLCLFLSSPSITTTHPQLSIQSHKGEGTRLSASPQQSDQYGVTNTPVACRKRVEN